MCTRVPVGWGNTTIRSGCVAHTVEWDNQVTPARIMAEPGSGTFIIGAATGDLYIKLIIGVDFLNNSGTDTQDLQHTCCRTTENDDRQYHHNEDCGTKSWLETRGQRDANGAT